MSTPSKMYLSRRSNGIYYVQYLADGRISYKSTGCKSKAEALQALASHAGPPADEPPFTRTVYPIFGALVPGDWDRFFSYHVWTYFPFGRMANSVRKTMEDPRMAVEQLLGVPIHCMAQDAQKVRGPREVTEGRISGLI